MENLTDKLKSSAAKVAQSTTQDPTLPDPDHEKGPEPTVTVADIIVGKSVKYFARIKHDMGVTLHINGVKTKRFAERGILTLSEDESAALDKMMKTRLDLRHMFAKMDNKAVMAEAVKRQNEILATRKPAAISGPVNTANFATEKSRAVDIADKTIIPTK